MAPLLRASGYDVDVVGSGALALEAASRRPPDLVLLDLGPPDLEGTEVCQRLRRDSAAAIVVLSARGGEADKVSALDLGADDYVTKPFAPAELLARIRSALRRTVPGERPATGSRLSVGRLTIDYDRHRVTCRRRRGPPDAEGIRAPLAARRERRPCSDARHDSEVHLGT